MRTKFNHRPVWRFPHRGFVRKVRPTYFHRDKFIITEHSDDFSFGPPKQLAAEAILAARKDRPDAVEYEFVQYKGEKIYDVERQFLTYDVGC